MDPVDVVFSYHERTKHHFNRYAPSPGYLDWATQPDPFRTYKGAPRIRLPLAPAAPDDPYDALYGLNAVPPRPIGGPSIGLFFECSLALSAWKQYENEKWALRCNPSSGNLHPTEGYLIAGPNMGLGASAGVYHYVSRDHALECRTEIDEEVWRALTAGFPNQTIFAGLTSIHWREAWKYGERAYRYCQHDAGHALGAIRLAAALCGWRATLVQSIADRDLSSLLGINREGDYPGAEQEHPDLLLAISPDHTPSWPRTLPSEIIQRIAAGEWFGQANRLSSDHVVWDAINAAAAACEKPATESKMPLTALLQPMPPSTNKTTAYRIIQQRRSAVAMDGTTPISREAFYRMLSRVMPSPLPPWDALPGRAAVHLGLFVHAVSGLDPGLYCLIRDVTNAQLIRKQMKNDFVWKRPASCPTSLPLFLLRAGEYRGVAASVSCGQEIAGAGAFAVAMLARIEPALREHGAWFYRRLHWETGMIGQILYLEAEAAGVRSTGIGCFFDDATHDVFGLRGRAFQTLYHFTVGGALEDARLSTLPPYVPKRRPVDDTQTAP